MEDTLGKLCNILEPVDLNQHRPNSTRSSPGRKTAILHGIGGAGKSQVALEYAYRFRPCYTSIFWIDSDDLFRTTESACKIVEQIVAHYVRKSRSAPDYQAISNSLGIPGKLNSSGKITQSATGLAIEAVHTWLAEEENQGWLLLVDNHDKGEDEEYEKLIPTCDWGCVLVTTRLANLDRFADLVEIEDLGGKASLDLLLKCSGKFEKNLIESELDKAREIVIALGELPLALDQAGAYIRFLRILFSDYRERLEKGMEASFKLKTQGFGLTPDKASVLTTWMLSVQELRADARKLLYLCAFLSDEDIPKELFRRGKSAVDWIQHMEEEDRFDDTVGELFTFSLAKRRDFSDVDSFCIHPLMQTWAREQIDSILRLQNIEDAIILVGSATGADNSDEMSSDNWIFKRRILSHLRVCQDNISKYFDGLDNENVSSASMKIGLAYDDLGYYKEAEALHQIAFTGFDKTLGKDHPSTLDTINNMANVFINQGRYEEALELHQRALAGREKALAKDHPSTLDTVHNMAIVFRIQGRYEEALELHQRALAGHEKALGKDHPSTLDTVHNMAIVFINQGRYEEALELYKRVLAGREKALGKDHPSTLDTVHNLASLFDDQGRYEESLELHQRALAGREKALGKDHPSTLDTVHNMAIFYENQKRYEEALELFQRAQDGCEKALEKDHPSTLDTVRCMASLLEDQGRDDEALQLKNMYAQPQRNSRKRRQSSEGP
ncbi:hypothetical protein RUND412_004599 [Rhizina undulata]